MDSAEENSTNAVLVRPGKFDKGVQAFSTSNFNGIHVLDKRYPYSKCYATV